MRRAWPTLLLLAAVAVLSTPGSHAEEAELPVFVSGPHHHVLAHWLRAAEEGTLPRRGVTIVHVDAHPDLALPRGPLHRGWPRDPARVVAAADIASFQLAAVRVGLVAEVIWLRPRWARQLPDGLRRFHLGAVELESSELALRVDDPSDYYVLDESWAPIGSLREPQPVRVRVLSLDAALEQARLGEGPTVLDIDLDTFATYNPAAERLRGAGLSDADLARVREIFDPAELHLAEDPPRRIRQTADLVDAVGALADGRWSGLAPSVAVFWRRGIGPSDLWSLWRILGRADGAAIDHLLNDGREVVGLPERRSDPAEIARTAEQLGQLLARGIVRPALVTIARSVDGGFTPRSAWPEIEGRLLAEIRGARPEARLRYDPGLQPAPPPVSVPGAAP